jgi:uncharacterized protein YdhG (YjbR/CyaY superfamily)
MKNESPILAYIEQQAPTIQAKLNQIRSIVIENAPNAVECISYGMPAFKQEKIILYFAAFKNHIGIYPTAEGVVAFEKWSKDFKTSKGAIQIPNDSNIPKALIKKLVLHRLEQVQAGPKSKINLCKNGHVFKKRSDCKTCPVCEKEAKAGFFIEGLAAPAVRALKANQISSLKLLSKITLDELKSYHGIGPNSIKQITKALNEAGLKFKK